MIRSPFLDLLSYGGQEQAVDTELEHLNITTNEHEQN